MSTPALRTLVVDNRLVHRLATSLQTGLSTVAEPVELDETVAARPAAMLTFAATLQLAAIGADWPAIGSAAAGQDGWKDGPWGALHPNWEAIAAPDEALLAAQQHGIVGALTHTPARRSAHAANVRRWGNDGVPADAFAAGFLWGTAGLLALAGARPTLLDPARCLAVAPLVTAATVVWHEVLGWQDLGWLQEVRHADALPRLFAEVREMHRAKQARRDAVLAQRGAGAAAGADDGVLVGGLRFKSRPRPQKPGEVPALPDVYAAGLHLRVLSLRLTRPLRHEDEDPHDAWVDVTCATVSPVIDRAGLPLLAHVATLWGEPRGTLHQQWMEPFTRGVALPAPAEPIWLPAVATESP